MFNTLFKGRRSGKTSTPATLAPLITPFEHTPEGKEDAIRALFHCASLFLETKDQATFDGLESHQKEFHQVFHTRLDGIDVELMDLISIAKILIFTKEETEAMLEVLKVNGADEKQKEWFHAEVDQANHFVRVLIGGNRTPYPDVDTASWSDADGGYTRYVRNLLTSLRNSPSKTAMIDQFLAIADLHYCNDQGRLVENLARQERENAEALKHAASVDYSEYPYGAVVILGHSPTAQEAKAGKTCSQMTIDKVDRSVRLNRQYELAPLYIVCGGSVRPQLTRVNEACSMKSYLIENYDIPPNQILIDATSEHTYSNFMNAVLIAGKASMPTGTKLAVFMVPDRYGCEGQYEFCINSLLGRAGNEVYPDLSLYFSIEDGTRERSVDLVLKADTEDFFGPILLWRDYTGERVQVVQQSSVP